MEKPEYENLINLRLTNEDYAHLLWMKHKFAEIVFTYINYTSAIESAINKCIAYRFVKKDEVLSNELISVVIMRLQFEKKNVIFMQMIENHYEELWKKYQDKIKAIAGFYKKRNLLSHSSLNSSPLEIKKFDKSRIAYQNMGSSLEQPVYIEINQFIEDDRALMMLMDVMGSIYSEIKKNSEA